MKDWSEVSPPQSVTVEHDHKPVLYLPDGRALVRQAGFHKGSSHAVSGDGRSALLVVLDYRLVVR